MTEQGAYGSRFGEHLHVENAPSFLARALPKTLIAATEVRSDHPKFEMSDTIPQEDAFLVALQVREFPVHEYWEGGRQTPVTSLKAGQTTIYDLKREPAFYMNNPFHSVHFYFPRTAFATIRDNAEAAHIDDLRYEPGVGIDDPVMRSLVRSLLPAFAHANEVSHLFVDHVMLAVGAHAGHTYGGMPIGHSSARGGLAPWQEHRATDLLAANLDGKIGVRDLARVCGLSVGHFSRAFRQTTGMAPHQWLMVRRLEAAKPLLRDRRRSLSEVALACGFADQSHFTRAFSRAVGTSPGAWRRCVEQ